MQTEIAWKLAEERDIPRAIFVNKLDRERASFERTLEQLKERFGAGVAPLHLPIGEEASFSGIVELLDDNAVTYNGSSPAGEHGDIPAEMEGEEHAVHDALVEGIVIGDDDMMERYLGDEKIEIAELAGALAQGIASGTVFPVLCGSATKLVGIDRLARFLVEEAPAPQVDDGPAAAIVFKTIVDSYVGHVNYFKVLQGTVKHDDVLANSRTHGDERIHQLFTMRGKEQDTVTDVAAGDIAAVAKLADTSTGDVLAAKGTTFEVDTVEPPDARARGRDQGPLEGRRGQARQRAAPPPGGGHGAAHRPQPRDAPDGAARHGRDAPLDRAREARAQVRRRGRHRRRARRVPRDDHRQGRGRGQAQEAERRPRPVRHRVAARSSPKRAARATSSSTRSSAA